MEERERMIAERDALLMQRAEQIVGLDHVVSERDGQIARHERLVAKLNQELDYRASLAWWVKSPWRFIKRAIKGKP